MSKPVHRGVTAPDAEDKGHAVGEVLSHLSDELLIALVARAIFSIKGKDCVALGHGESVASQDIHLLFVVMEFHLDMEGLVGVNRFPLVSKLVLIVVLVKRTEATSLTVLNEAVLIRVVTSVNGRPEGILVGLHDVELGAEVVGRVGIAVPEAICVVELAILGHGRELDKIDGRIAATLSLAEVHIILNRASEEMNLEDIVGVSDGYVVGL